MVQKRREDSRTTSEGEKIKVKKPHRYGRTTTQERDLWPQHKCCLSFALLHPNFIRGWRNFQCAGLCFLSFANTTETGGKYFWKNQNKQKPLRNRRPWNSIACPEYISQTSLAGVWDKVAGRQKRVGSDLESRHLSDKKQPGKGFTQEDDCVPIFNRFS